MPFDDLKQLLIRKQTENLKFVQKYAHLYCIILYMPHPQPFFDYSCSHTSTAILFCDITKSSENVIVDIILYELYSELALKVYSNMCCSVQGLN